jgi:hypothetical protein
VRGDGRDEPSTILVTSLLTILLQRGDAPIDLSEDGFIHMRSEARILRSAIAYFC